MTAIHLLRPVAALLATAVLFSSCSTTRSNQTAQGKQAAAPLYKWWGDDLSGPVSIRINLNEQKGTIYRGGQEAGWTVLATGTTHHRTPSGTFYVMEKIPDKVSNTYGVIVNGSSEIVNGDAQAGVTHVPAGCRFVGASMPYWMRITGYGVGMHAGDIPEPGLPASHGCIRLPRDFAGTLYNVVSVGTPVIITGS
ncbi:MAG TPA: L,D-transpeptidase family protein [Verrucomicrobiaceae bacterium]